VEDFEPENIRGALKVSGKIHGYIPKKESFSRVYFQVQNPPPGVCARQTGIDIP